MRRFLLIQLFLLALSLNILNAQQARNSNGSSDPEQPATIYLGDNGTFGHDSWADLGGNYPRWRVVIHTSDNIADGTYGDYTGYNNVENKTQTSPRFTSTGLWYWGMQVDYGGTLKWYNRNDANWHNMWDTPTSNLTITVSALENPANLSATAASNSQINLSWNKWNSKNVMIVRRLTSADPSDAPTQGNSYNVDDLLGTGTVIYNSGGTSFTDTDLIPGTSYTYVFYSENFSYYSVGASDAASTTAVSAATDHFRSKETGNWHVAGSWESSEDGSTNWFTATLVPGADATSITIRDGHNITLNDNAIVGSLTIATGGTLTASDATARTLTISDGGTLTNNGTFTAGTGKVSFAGSGTVSGTVVFNDVDISGGVNFGDNSTVAGVLQINAGGYVNTKAPTYETGSILRYNTGTDYGISSEWYADQTLGAGVPYNVDISSSTQVHFSGSQDHTMNGNLTIATGKIFTLSETIGADLFIKGDFINNGGTFNSNSRLVTFNGTTSQEIKGTGPTSFGYVTIDNSAGVSINGSELITVANDLTVNASTSLSIEPGRSLTVTGTLTNNAGATGLVIKSDASGTGSLKTDGAVSGSITAQRYFGGSNWDWHLLSSPVSNQNIQNEFVPESFTTDEDFYCYYEPTSEWVNYKNSTTPPTWATANGDNTFVEGKGYMVSYNDNGFTKSFTGTPNTGSQSFDLSKVQSTGDYIGVNLAGNPYPSSIDWKAATGWTRTDLVNTNTVETPYYNMYIWNPTENNYGVYNSGSVSDFGTNSVTRYIPPMQGFFVNAATNGGSLSMTNDVRVHNNASNWLKNADNNSSQFRIIVSSVDNYGTDEVVIETGHETNAGGALKMFSFVESAPSLYLPKENKNYSISFLQDVPAGTTIPLYFGAGIDGQYELAFTFDYQLYTNVKLSDKETGIITDITENSVYQFFSAKNDDPNRFLLHFGVVGVGEQEQAPTLQAYMVDNRLYVNNSLEQAQLAVYDLQGRLVAEQSLNSGGLQSLPLELPAGVYIVRLNNASESRAVKINVQ